jgi:pyruvate/2-oxoglutarate dehydrogenase complex dihydrolipoamide dehydrogenase (E3) component
VKNINLRDVGCEFAAIYRGLGCQVTLAEQSERLLPDWDESVGSHIAQQLPRDGVELMLGRRIPVNDLPMNEGWPITAKADGTEISPDLVLVVGWMEREAAEAGVDVRVESEVAEMVTADDKMIAEPSKTLIKIIAERSTKQIRGCVAIGNQASEVVNLAALAIQSGVGTREIERLLLIHPSASVAFQRCATKFHDEHSWHDSIMNVLSRK